MHLIGCCLALYVVPAELFIRLRSTEKVRCKLCAAHVVKNVLALFQAFPEP